MTKEKIVMDLNKHEANLILFCRKLEFGKVCITISDGIPRWGEQIKKDLKFDSINLTDDD